MIWAIQENENLESDFENRFNILEEALGKLTDKMVVLAKNLELKAEISNNVQNCLPIY